MAQRFIVEIGELKGQSISFDEGSSWVFGKDETQSQIVIPDSSIADAQFVIRRTSQGLLLENLSPEYPTLINDSPLGSSSTLLKSGDTVRIGGELFRFEEVSSLDKTEEDFISSALEESITEDESEKEDLAEAAETPSYQTESESLSTEPQEDPFKEDEDFSFDEDLLEETSPEDEAEEAKESEEVIAEEEEDEIDVEDDLEPISPSDDEERYAPSAEEEPSFEEGLEQEEEPSQQQMEGDLPTEEEGFLKHEETLFSDELNDAALAEIDFGVVETGRWLLKVIGGPNTGAEFYMKAGENYVLGTDPVNSDIVFQDTSVSRQHAKITVSSEDSLLIEDLKSRNGVLINGEQIQEPHELEPNTIVTLGTTSFAIYDREGEMQTIISPLLPSIVRTLQKEEFSAEQKTAVSEIDKKEGETITPSTEQIPQEPVIPISPSRNYGPLILLAVVIGIFALAAIGTTALFQVQQVVITHDQNVEEKIKGILAPYTALRYSYNNSTGNLLLLGHVLSIADKNHIVYKLNEIKGIQSIDDKGLIIDELAWNEVNTVLSDNPAWRGISLHAPEAGHFVLTGYLKTRKQAEELTNYISRNFPYLDMLKKQVVVEEDIIQSIQSILSDKQLRGVQVKVNNGEVQLSGEIAYDRAEELPNAIAEIRQIPGVRVVYNQVISQNPEKIGVINLSDQYTVTGKSQIGEKYTVLIQGKLLSQGGVLDGMEITKITGNTIFLERGDKKYRIDY